MSVGHIYKTELQRKNNSVGFTKDYVKKKIGEVSVLSFNSKKIVLKTLKVRVEQG